MRARLFAAICIALLVSAVAVAQTCIINAPSKPPRATRLIVDLPVLPDGGVGSLTLPDGGPATCSLKAEVPGGVEPGTHGTTLTKCNQARALADQAAAIDNGWNDGGNP